MIRLALALVAAAVPSIAGACAKMPPPEFWQEPTLPYEVFTAPANAILSWCHKDPRMTYTLLGCTYEPDVTPKHDGVIILNAGLSDSDRVCVLIYEKAHLPPNNWYDPVMEATAPNRS